MATALSLSLSFIPVEAGLGTAAVCDCDPNTVITDFSSESATTPRTVTLKLSSVLMFGFLSAVFTLAAAQKSVATLPVCV